MRKPLVSIKIPNYNKDKYLKESVESLLYQTYKPIEVIVVDDGSSDNSKVKIEKFDDHIKVFFLPYRNANFARNPGFTEFSGDFIQFLDADDTVNKDTIEKQIEFLIASLWITVLFIVGLKS